MAGKYLVRTYGCQMNEHDSERISGLLEADGMQVAASESEADVIVLNTCCIRENADNKLYGHLGELTHLKRDNPELQIAVAGCLAQKDRDAIQARAGHVDVVFGTHNVHRAAELLKEARRSGPVTEILEETVLDEADAFPSALPVRREVDWSGWVTIQIGCDNSCAFCIVPAVRGREISRPFGSIVEEVERLAADGVVEVSLLGQNVNSYGRDLTLSLRRGETPEGVKTGTASSWVAGDRWEAESGARPRALFADLLRTVGSIDGIRRVRYTSPHPKDMGADVAAAMGETAAVCEHLHLPLQSGSDRVLSAMHRGYTAQRYLERVTEARALIPDLALTTDIIVGFPGESDEDFAATLEVAAAADYDSAYTFVYSPRPGTEAAEMSADFVDPEVVKDRFARLRVVVERTGLARHQARIGRTEEVIVEGPSKRDPEVLTGRTRQNKLVHFRSEPLRPGTLAMVEVATAAPHHLGGELVDILARPSHKTRIPVAAL